MKWLLFRKVFLNGLLFFALTFSWNFPSDHSIFQVPESELLTGDTSEWQSFTRTLRNLGHWDIPGLAGYSVKMSHSMKNQTTTKWCAPSKDSDQSGHSPTLISLCCLHEDEETLATHWTYNEDFDQTGWMHRLIGVFARHTSVCWFCHALAQMVAELFFFLFGFDGPSRLFHSFWAESILRRGENGRSLKKKTPNHPEAELGLPHMWPELDSNPQQWDDEPFRVLKFSSLNHSAMGATYRTFWTPFLMPWLTYFHPRACSMPSTFSLVEWWQQSLVHTLTWRAPEKLKQYYMNLLEQL